MGKTIFNSILTDVERLRRNAKEKYMMMMTCVYMERSSNKMY